MRKLRFAIVLPVLMACLAVPVTLRESRAQTDLLSKREYPTVPTAILVYRGINAPALLFKQICTEVLPVYRVDRPPPTFLGIGVGELVFFLGVVTLWCSIGVLLDRWRLRKVGLQPRSAARKLVVSSSLLVTGIALFYGEILSVTTASGSTNPSGASAEGSLFLLWSVALALSAARGFLNVIRGNRRTSPPGPP